MQTSPHRFIALTAAAALVTAATPVAGRAGTLTCENRQVTIQGTEDSETINGTPDDDVILARGGDDVVLAGAGNDVVCGGEGNDDIGGGSGRDRLLGGAGNDIIRGKEDTDYLQGMAGDDRLFGGEDGGAADVDTVAYLGSADGMRIDLQAGIASELDVVDALGDGNDLLNGFEWAEGSPFTDHITGNNEDNRLSGFDGADRLDGASGSDDLRGGPGGDGGDTATYATSTEAVVVDLAAGRARAGEAIDLLDSIENAEGSALPDGLFGDDAANTFKGLRGNDLFVGRGGPDTFGGGAGKDIVSYASVSARVQVDLRAGTATVGSSQADVLESIENFRGSQGRDVVFGTGGPNLLVGNGGNDELNGRVGKDTLLGRKGSDTLNGQKGDDVLVGGNGDDSLNGGAGDDRCFPGAGTDTLRNCD